MTTQTLGTPGDPWGAAPDTATPPAPLPAAQTPEMTALQAAFAAAQQCIPLTGSEVIGGPGSGCTLTGAHLCLLLDNVADYSMEAASRDLDLDLAGKTLDGDAFDLFDLAHSGDVRGFAHRYHRLHPARPGPTSPATEAAKSEAEL